MKLVRYDDPVDGTSVDLHPLLTVVSGWTRDARDRLAAAVASLAEGGPVTAGGELDVHGIRLALTPQTLELLEMAFDAPTVLTAADLPEAPGDGFEDVDDEELEQRIAAARELLEAATARRTTLSTALPEAERGLADVTSRRASLAATIEATRGELDPDAVEALRGVTEELAALVRRRTDEVILERAGRRAELERRLDELIAEVDAVRRDARRLPVVDPAAVVAARARLADVIDPTPVPDQSAAALAAELDSAMQEWATHQQHTTGARTHLLELTARRDAAHDAMVAAERLLRPPKLDAAATAELERVHDEIFDLEGRTSRLSAARLRRRSAELRERERTLLDEAGFDSWTSYVMGVASADAEADRVRRYESAKATFDFAEDELSLAAGQPLRESPEAIAAEQRVAELRSRATLVLGGALGTDPIGDLRSHTVTAGSLLGSVDAAAAALRSALAGAGVEVDDHDPASVLMARADEWLTSGGRRSGERTALDERVNELEDQIARTHETLGELAGAIDVEAELPEHDPEVVEIRARLAATEVAVARHDEATSLLAALDDEDAYFAGLQAEFTEAVARVQREIVAADDALAAAVEAVSEAEAHQEHVIGERERVRQARLQAAPGNAADSVEWSVLARLAALRSVSFVGSVPLVVDGALDGWSFAEMQQVYDRLARMSDVVQVIVLTDDPEVTWWAESLGSERAGVLSPALPGAF